MYALFATLLLAAALMLTFWTEVRLRESTPLSPLAVVLHLPASVLAFAIALHGVEASDGRALGVLSVMAGFFPALVYVFVSALWTLKLLQRAVMRA